MDLDRFLELRKQAHFKKWYESLSRSEQQQEVMYARYFSQWIGRRRFQDCIKRLTQAGEDQAALTFAVLDDADRVSLREYFEIYACTMVKLERGVKQNFFQATGRGSGEFLRARNEFACLVNALDERDFIPHELFKIS